MEKETNHTVYQKLEDRFREAELFRPLKLDRYNEGSKHVYDICTVPENRQARIHLRIERFVGGGFAGQVYQVKLLKIEAPEGPIEGIEAGGRYAMKILIPPLRFSKLFRNVLYGIGFQASFQLQTNPSAARAGALWQKFFRRGAKLRFGDEKTVVDIYATFVDPELGSCGELSEWVDGRTWRLEVDDHLDALKRWRKGKPVKPDRLGSPEFRSKYIFMRDFVQLLHDMGGHEFARQYEWSTCKSQPNCLKRIDTEKDPSGGLVAVDFRAGLVLLPFLPMSPGDLGLLIKGLFRGSLVQFDRGNLRRLERFMDAHQNDFADMREVWEELKKCEHVYRDSVPDITHHHLRLFYSRRLWSTILESAAAGWRIKNIVDDRGFFKLRQSHILKLCFFFLGVVPWAGTLMRRIWAHHGWRRHYRNMLTHRGYFKRAFRANMAEKMIVWHRAGRFDDAAALKVSGSPWRFLGHQPLALLPASVHRFLTDWAYAGERLVYIFIRPFKLYFDSASREKWFSEIVSEGRQKNILSAEDSRIILSQIGEPFIQKYLKSLAVHVCTLPVTQVVSVMLAIIFVALHPEMPRSQAWGIGLGIIALFQVLPLSPGSLVRGFYVLYLVIRERNFKDYNIAVFLGFFKYVGYLAFPIQMAYRYPVLAGFMAGHWANQAVHIVPVFGESGALLEHWIFRLFYNWPLTIRRRILKRLKLRASMQKRFWHIGVCALAAGMLLGSADFAFFHLINHHREIWFISMPLAFICGSIVTSGAGGATLWERIVGSAVCGLLTAVVFTLFSALLPFGSEKTVSEIATTGIWRLFAFAIFAAIGAIYTELKLRDPDL